MLPVFAYWEGKTVKKIRMCFPNEKTFREGFEEYILDCKARNLREGTINHYQEFIYKNMLITLLQFSHMYFILLIYAATVWVYQFC